LLPKNRQSQTFTNFTPVMRTSHPFIIGNETATTYIYNMLVRPIDSPIQAVSGSIFDFANGTIGELAMTVSPQIVIAGEPFAVALQMTQDQGSPFNMDLAQTAQIGVSLTPVGVDTASAPDQRLSLNDARSFMGAGNLYFDAPEIAAPKPGIYTLTLTTDSGAIAQQYLYVLEN
jgi:hypothetical protein